MENINRKFKGLRDQEELKKLEEVIKKTNQAKSQRTRMKDRAKVAAFLMPLWCIIHDEPYAFIAEYFIAQVFAQMVIEDYTRFFTDHVCKMMKEFLRS